MEPESSELESKEGRPKMLERLEKAAELYASIPGFNNNDADERARACHDKIYAIKYEMAEEMVNPLDAAEAFAEIRGYRDADERARKCIYDHADAAASKKLASSQEYAAKAFALISGYRDADERAKECARLAEHRSGRDFFGKSARILWETFAVLTVLSLIGVAVTFIGCCGSVIASTWVYVCLGTVVASFILCGIFYDKSASIYTYTTGDFDRLAALAMKINEKTQNHDETTENK